MKSGEHTRKVDLVQDDAERFYREQTRVWRLRWIGIGIELILVGVGCIIASVFFTTRLPVRSGSNRSPGE